MHALKKQRKRERRKAHAKQADQRNRDRGFTSSDLHRNSGNEAKAKAASMVGRQTPSYHKPEPVKISGTVEANSGPHSTRLHRDEVELKPVKSGVQIITNEADEPFDVDAIKHSVAEIMSVEIFDELRAEARKKRKAFGKVAEGAGWTLTQGGFKNKPEDWSR